MAGLCGAFALLLKQTGLKFVCVGADEGIELGDGQISPERFPWTASELLVGAVRVDEKSCPPPARPESTSTERPFTIGNPSHRTGIQPRSAPKDPRIENVLLDGRELVSGWAH